ncbi:OCR-like antirestriction protein [Streptomyces phage Triumph]|nr:OCR-like antirestriction protein [Streptomyces phage Triumph]
MPTVIERIEQYDPEKLAELAGSPDIPESRVSEGADFLARVRDAVVDRVQAAEEEGEDLRSVREAIQSDVSDAAPSSDIDEKWRQFVDLAAYKEDLSDHGKVKDDTPSGHADVALMAVAHRLTVALLDEILEG